MTNHSGRGVANQMIITDGNNETFQSYRSAIVRIERENGARRVILDPVYYNYSKTTARYRNLFLGEDTKTIEAKIKSGEYILADLNN